MQRNGRISQVQKMARATPKAKARRQEQDKTKLGAAPYQKQPGEKPPWSCTICWEEFWNEGREAKYAVIPGAKKRVPLGPFKGYVSPGFAGEHRREVAASARLQAEPDRRGAHAKA